MMRCLVLLSAVFLVQADDTVSCSLDGARAVDDLLDGATYIWASVQRCGGAPTGDAILCSLDISAAIESVNAMVNVILKAVQRCGHLESENAQCGLAVGVLTRSFAGLAAASSGITAKCPNQLNNYAPKVPLVYNVNATALQNQNTNLAQVQNLINAANATKQASFAQCLVDIKDLTKSLFKAIKRIMTLKESCADGKAHCAHNSLKLVASLGAMGQYLSAAVGRCSADTVANKGLIIESECSAEVLHLVRHVSNVARASVDLQQNCHVGSERLYQIEHGIVENQSSNSMTLALAAFLPLTAVLSFVGGSRFAKSRSQNFVAVTVEE